ncbi:MAG: DUF6279 family lipoprotein [Nitrospirales bacterium]
MSVLVIWYLLVSCSAIQITYSTADWILLWKLDSYFDLSASQEEYLDREIKNFHVWHRRHQLPEYSQFLVQIDQFWENGLSQAELETIFTSVDHFRILLAQQASPPGAIFLSTLTPAQIQHFQEVLDREHRQRVAKIGKNSDEHLTRRMDSALAALTTWLGDMSVDQEASIQQWIAEFPDTADVWLAHRKNRQSRLIELLLRSPDALSLKQGLSDWLADSKAGGTPEYLLASREWREGVQAIVLKIDQILTPKQRAHFSKKLQRLIRDIQDLVGPDSKYHQVA